MVDSLKSLPPAEEISRIFNDFKEVLKVARYRTPLQRIHRLTTQYCAVTYSHKLQTEADRILNLLPPGLNTVHNVDLLRLMLISEQNFVLRIPVSLLDCGGKYALMRNTEAGVVLVKMFKDSEKAWATFKEEVNRCSALPQYVHKCSSSSASLHTCLDSAVALWTRTSFPQQLQQFIPPVYKSPCFLRVHWSRKWSKPRCYLITRGSSLHPNSMPSILSGGKSMGRAFSNPPESGYGLFGQDIKGLSIQKMRKGPELRKELDTCARVLGCSLRAGLGLREMVCDFKPTDGRKWIFLKCQGYTVETRMKVNTSFLEQHETVDLRFLMYPLVANRFLLRNRLKWSNKLKTIAAQQTQQVVIESNEECMLGSESSMPSETEPRSEDRNTPTARKRVVVKTLLAKGVLAYDRLVQGSREFKEEQKGKTNIMESCGGEAVWKQHIHDFFLQFHASKDIASFFTENLSIEEANMITCSLLRVIRGDYSFYYKEALKKMHHRLHISTQIYHLFLLELHKHLTALIDNKEEASLVLRRFQQLQEYICAPEKVKSAKVS